MLHKLPFILVLICLQLACFSAQAEDSAADHKIDVQFATDPWPPFFLETKSQTIHEGLGYELVVELFKLIPDATPSFPKLPWKRALLEVEKGSKDAVALLLKTDERSEYMLFTKPVIQTPALMFYNKKSFPTGFEWQDVNDFDKYRIGVVQGYSYGEVLDSYIATKPKNVFEVTTSIQLFAMLQRQHIDLVPENSAVAYTVVANQGWSDTLGAADKIISTDVLHIGISKKTQHPSILEKLNHAIDDMRDSGRIDQLLGDIGSSVHLQSN